MNTAVERKLTAVELKVRKLVAQAEYWGFEAGVTNISDKYVVVYMVSGNLKCRVVETEAGNASVTTWERGHKVPNSSLDKKLSYYKSMADRRT